MKIQVAKRINNEVVEENGNIVFITIGFWHNLLRETAFVIGTWLSWRGGDYSFYWNDLKDLWEYNIMFQLRKGIFQLLNDKFKRAMFDFIIDEIEKWEGQKKIKNNLTVHYKEEKIEMKLLDYLVLTSEEMY